MFSREDESKSRRMGAGLSPRVRGPASAAVWLFRGQGLAAVGATFMSA